jgi:hypothetical protein
MLHVDNFTILLAYTFGMIGKHSIRVEVLSSNPLFQFNNYALCLTY